MKKLLVIAAALCVAGAGAATLNRVSFAETKADGVWYYRGNDTSKTADFDHGSDEYTITEGAAATSWTFTVGEKFKFYSQKDGWKGSTYSVTLAGSAASLFSGSGDSDICYNGAIAGTYDVVLAGGKLYLDYQDNAEFYYSGTDASKAGETWTNWTEPSKVIKVNGEPVTFSLSASEEFKLRPQTDASSWDGALGFAALPNNYFSCFEQALSNGNIKVNYAASYDFSIAVVDHSLTITVAAHDSFNTVYVLDFYGDLLNVAHKAHIYNGSISSEFPGVDMVKETGNNIYSLTYWDDFTTVNFNQKGDGAKTGQTINLTLTGNENKCLILNHDVDGEYKWNSNTWLSLPAAQFIDQKMHFGDYNESQYTIEPTANCATNYDAAKTAYNALASNAIRKEVLSIESVKARLGAWAKANGDSIDVESGDQISAAGIISFIQNGTSDDALVAWPLIAIFAVITVGGGLFLLRKRKAE